jgi:hypothetical protein
MKHITFSLTLIALSCLSLFGGETGHVTCRILFLDRPANAPTTLHLFDGTASREVDLPGMNLSKTYQLPASTRTLALLPDAIDNPENLPEGAPTAELPEGASDFYLIVSSDPENAVAPVSLRVIDPGADGLLPGQTLWVNLTPHTLRGSLGERELLVEPHATVILDAPRDDAGDFPVSINFKVADSETPRPVCETRWIHDPRARNLAIAYPKASSTSPRISVFADLR